MTWYLVDSDEGTYCIHPTKRDALHAHPDYETAIRYAAGRYELRERVQEDRERINTLHLIRKDQLEPFGWTGPDYGEHIDVESPGEAGAQVTDE